MTETQIIDKAIEEVENRALNMTKQFLEIHKIVYVDNKPKIAKVDLDKEDEVIVYFNVENEKFFLAVYVQTKPEVFVRWTNTQPYHEVYLRASSNTLSFYELAELTKLSPVRVRNNGDKRRPETSSSLIWKHSLIDLDPNGEEPDRFEDKLTKLLDFLETDKKGIENLVNKTDYCCIHVYSSFHNGNTLIGGHHIGRNLIQRISKLNLEIDFDISADGNYFAATSPSGDVAFWFPKI